MTLAAKAKRQKALDLIAQAQSLLSDAAQETCPLVGFVDQWEEIGGMYDKVKALWHRVNNAPYPERLDSETPAITGLP